MHIEKSKLVWLSLIKKGRGVLSVVGDNIEGLFESN